MEQGSGAGAGGDVPDGEKDKAGGGRSKTRLETTRRGGWLGNAYCA